MFLKKLYTRWLKTYVTPIAAFTTVFICGLPVMAEKAPPATIVILNLEDHCDIVGGNLRPETTKDPEACRQKCLDNESCLGFTFITSWQRCFLKASITRVTKVEMISGAKDNPHLYRDHDAAGKDIKQEAASDVESCRNLCAKQHKCVSYTYIKGYSSCWLKRTLGEFYPKIFYCGVKKTI